jgi:RNA polymerase sigma factor (sigma-70 family)
MELAHDGHERAFEALVHRYRRQLLAYCRRLTGAGSSAEDLLQQALLQAWVAIGRDGEIRDVRAWLYRIAHNVCISDFRRNGVAPAELDGAVSGRGADFEAERRLAAREALAGLAALPDLQRQVMLSTALEGRSHEEIAALMGLSHGAVRGLIYRARATLRAAAAAVIPGPLITWAARQDVGRGPGSAGLVEAIATGGGGVAGVSGLVIKGAVVVAAAGGLASAVGVGPVVTGGHSHHTAAARAGAASASGPGRPAQNTQGAVVAGRRAAARFVALSPHAGRHHSQSGRRASPGGPGGSSVRSPSASRSGSGGGGSGGGGPSRGDGRSGTSGSGGHDGGSGSGGMTSGGSGSDGGSSSTSGSGSGGSGRDGGSSSTSTSGSDGGSSGGSLSSSDGRNGGTSGGDGGSSSGSDGGSSPSGGVLTSGQDGSGSGH